MNLMQNKKERAPWGPLVALFVLGVAVGMVFTLRMESQHQGGSITIQNVVEHGHAEWYVEEHSQKWRWKQCDSCAPTKVAE